MSLRSVLALTLAGTVALTACGSDDSSSADTVKASPAINVISSDDPVSQLLGMIYGKALENAGFRIGRKDPVADEQAAYDAVSAGRAQLTVDTMVTLLTRADTSLTAIPVKVDDQTTALNAKLPKTVAANPVSSVDAGLTVACTAAAIDEYTLTDISSLAKVADKVTLGIPAGFDTAKPLGLATITDAYETEFPTTVTVDAGGVGAAATAGSFDCVVTSKLDPDVTVSGLLPLEDDKAALPTDMVVPLLAVIENAPEVVSMLTTVNASLTTDVVRALLVKVSTGAQTYDTAAKAFLASLSDQSGQ